MTQITETTQTTHHAEIVTLTGAPLPDLRARAHELWQARDGFLWRCIVSQIDGAPKIQMEFSKGDET